MKKTSSRLVAGLFAFVLAGPLTAQDPADERERDVLSVLRRATELRGGRFSTSEFTHSRNAFGSPVVLAQSPVFCGNSFGGSFDAGPARRLALELFRAYGWTPYADQVIREGGIATRLDGYDGEAKLGFKLRGAPIGAWTETKDEDERTGLSAAEFAQLAGDGIRLHVADLADYPLMDGDQFTPTLAYLAGVVEFLNTVTDGPDVDLQALLMQREQRFPFPEELSLPPGVSLERTRDVLLLSSTESVQVILPVGIASIIEVRKLSRMTVSNYAGDYEDIRAEVWGEVDQALSTVGRPTVLQLRNDWGAGAHVALRVHQEGPRPLKVATTSAVVFLPSTFDARRPFTLMITLVPGVTRIAPYVFVGAGH
jgi:hypothetical protein